MDFAFMLKSLSLENFRNYEKFSLDFEQTTIIVGPNGVGKTNIIEAIYLLSTGRSWRTKHDSEAVRWDKDFTKIQGKISLPKEEELELIIQRIINPSYPQLKLVKINASKKRLTELLGKMPSVLFSPEELKIVDGTPSLRRRLLDIILCQVDKKYTLALLDLAKIIRERNKLLFYIKIGKSKVDELAFWDEKLITLGRFIITKRQKLIDVLNLELTTIYQKISGGKEHLKIKYKPGVEIEKFSETLAAGREREIESAATLFGPHRDDLIFFLDFRDVVTFGSRGEYRSIIFALKIAEIAFLEKENEVKPILLLDDIFSELDSARRQHLAKIVADKQTIITTTDLDHIEKSLREKAKVIELK